MVTQHFDFDRWWKDLNEDQKDRVRLIYKMSFEEMRLMKKNAGWVVNDNGSVQFNGAHGFIPPTVAAPYLQLTPPDGKWTFEERDDLLKQLTICVNAHAQSHSRTQEEVRKVIMDMCNF